MLLRRILTYRCTVWHASCNSCSGSSKWFSGLLTPLSHAWTRSTRAVSSNEPRRCRMAPPTQDARQPPYGWLRVKHILFLMTLKRLLTNHNPPTPPLIRYKFIHFKCTCCTCMYILYKYCWLLQHKVLLFCVFRSAVTMKDSYLFISFHLGREWTSEWNGEGLYSCLSLSHVSLSAVPDLFICTPAKQMIVFLLCQSFTGKQL